jgi:integrase
VKLGLKFLCEDCDRHGKVRLYVRRNGRKIRLRARWGTPEFLDAYYAALAATEVATTEDTISKGSPAPRNSLRWLFGLYFASAEYRLLDPRTRRIRRRDLEALSEKHGTKPFERMEARHVRHFQDEKAELPEAANARLKALRAVFKWAVAAEHAERNPTLSVPYIKTRSEGWHTWTVDEVKQYLSFHGRTSPAGRALIFLLYTGAARGDLVTLGRQHCRKGCLVFKRRKTKVEVEIPILPELQAAIEATPSSQLSFIVTEFGRPFTAAGFGNRMREWCNKAGLPNCSAHGLRKAAATIAADNGASAHQLMAIFGWKTLKQAEHYTRKADRRRLASDGMQFISLGQIENESVPPEPSVPIGGQKMANSAAYSRRGRRGGAQERNRTTDTRISPAHPMLLTPLRKPARRSQRVVGALGCALARPT